MIRFIVPGEPIGKARARAFANKRTGRINLFTPNKTANYENLVKIEAEKVGDQYYIDSPLRMHITAYFSIPKSTSKKKAELMRSGKIRPTKKPDIDNIIKIIADALNGVSYKDDSQIVRVTAEKFYAEIPRVDVIIDLLPDNLSTIIVPKEVTSYGKG